MIVMIRSPFHNPRDYSSITRRSGLTRFGLAVLLGLVTACAPTANPPAASLIPTASFTQATDTAAPAEARPTTLLPSPTLITAHTTQPAVTSTPKPTVRPVPEFSHVIIFVLENHEIGFVIGNSSMPNYNHWAGQYTLLTQYYAITHPSLPNYLALVGGDTFGIHTDCEDCFVNQPSLPDLIEGSGRTWRAYEEDMPSPCFSGSTLSYAQKHDPFVYFDPIRKDPARCKAGVVPLTQLEGDLSSGKLPDFAFVMPNLCNSAHDCTLDVTDAWLGRWVGTVMASPTYDAHTLIVLTWDEGQGNHGCCGVEPGGGQVATVLISPLVRQGFKDDTPYTHYSLLKTIAEAWGLKPLGHAADAAQAVIEQPFK